MPVNDRYPGATSGTYTIREGDFVESSVDQTLRNVALAVWGDGSLWYILADANGLTSNSPAPQIGQTLVVPNVIANVHNNASTFKVYNPGELIGNTTPTLPDPPPPQPEVDRWEQALKILVVVIVAVVVIALTDGLLSGVVEPWVATALSAAAGDAASQVAAKKVGLRDHFSWSEVGTTALTAGLTYGVDTGEFITTALLRDAVAQGIRMARNPEAKFSWGELLAAPINTYIDLAAAGTSNGLSLVGATLDGFTTDIVSGLAKGVVNSLAIHRGKIEWSNVAASALGTAIGNTISANIGVVQGARLNRQEAWEDYYDQSGWSYEYNPNGTLRVTGTSGAAAGSFVDTQLQDIFGESAQRGAERMAEAVRTGPLYADNNSVNGTRRDVSGSTDSLYLRGGDTGDATAYNNLMEQNARIVNEAAVRGESLAPTVETAARLGLQDRASLLPPAASPGPSGEVGMNGDRFMPREWEPYAEGGASETNRAFGTPYGWRDTDTGQFSSNPLSGKALADTWRQAPVSDFKFSVDAELAKYTWYSDATQGNFVNGQLVQNENVFVGARDVANVYAGGTAALGSDGFKTKLSVAGQAGITYVQVQTEANGWKVSGDVTSGAVGAVNAEARISLANGGLSGSVAAQVSGDAALLRAGGKFETPGIDIGPLTLSLEGKGEGHLLGIGGTLGAGIETYKTRPGGQFFVEAGITPLLVGGRGKVTVKWEMNPDWKWPWQ